MLVNRMLYKLLRTCTKFLLNNNNKLFLIFISNLNLFIVACIPAQGVNDAQSISMSDRQQIPATTKAAHSFPNGKGNFCALAPFPNLIPDCPTGLCHWCVVNKNLYSTILKCLSTHKSPHSSHDLVGKPRSLISMYFSKYTGEAAFSCLGRNSV